MTTQQQAKIEELDAKLQVKQLELDMCISLLLQLRSAETSEEISNILSKYFIEDLGECLRSSIQ